MRMRENTAYIEFKKARWPKTNGVPDHCPQCGSVSARFYETNRRRFRCSDCRGDFSVTSKTNFASHKLSFRDMLAALSLAANAVKNEAALLLTRQLGVQWKTAFVLMTKLREAIASERVALTLDGTVEIDGCYIGGHRRKENRKADRKDARLVENQTGKRRCVLVLRQRSGRTVTCQSARKRGSDSLLMVPSLCWADHAGLEEIEVSAAIHLAFDKLEFRDLSFGLAV